MSNGEQLTKLDNLENEISIWVLTTLNNTFFDDSLEVHVSLSRHINAGEKITQETEEDIDILSNNLWNVEISKRSQKNSLFGNSRLGSLHDSCDHKYGLDGTETPIVMSGF